MVDYSIFDSILDSAFIVDGDGKIVYCNDAAATLCQTSVRRLTGKVVLSDLLHVAEPNIFPFTADSQGRLSPTSFIETEFKLLKVERTGKVQLAIRPVDETSWAFFLRDVSLEEALHTKYRSELAQKEDYARNLEKLVEARTAELASVNQTLNAILDSLGQGFFTFNTYGDAGEVYTKACEDILEGAPKGRKAWVVLGVPDKELKQFQSWMDSLFKEVLPFDDLKPLGPSNFPHSKGRHVVLDYFPIRRDQTSITDVVVVATDKTAEYQAQKALEAERLYASMIVKFTKNKDQFLSFLASVRISMKQLKGLAESKWSAESVNESFRILHTLEGEAGTFSLSELRRLSRECQHVLEPFKGEANVPLRPVLSYLNSLKALSAGFEAFLVEQKDLIKLPDGEVSRTLEIPHADISAFLNDVKSLPSGDTMFAKGLDMFLKEPVEKRLKYFDGLIQTVAERLGKKVKPLKIQGGDLRIFPEPYERMFSSLVHAFRNAVDHGLESPEDREWGGKDPAGLISIMVKPSNRGMSLIVKDDGRGIDPAVIRKKLSDKFPEKDYASMSDEEIIQQVCQPGFSSRESVGEFSGRGVGLDALREEVVKVGGTLQVKSKVNEGTEIDIFIPDLSGSSSSLRSA